MKKIPKILIVAMTDSVHTKRWLDNIYDTGWDIHLFPSIDAGVVYPGIKNVTVHQSFYGKFNPTPDKLKISGLPLGSEKLASLARLGISNFFPNYRIKQLASLIDKIKPDIVHSIEMQHAGYLTLASKKLIKSKFPPWVVTNYGSDIYFFGMLNKHISTIKKIMEECDYYKCESYRDVNLAKQFGFKGKILPVFPNSGGIKIGEINHLTSPGPASKRKIIMLKGYQNWAGRCLVGLRALEICKKYLKGYKVVVYSAKQDVQYAAERFSYLTSVPTEILPYDSPRETILNYHGLARVSMGLSITDGIPTSLLEAIAVGSFPIQSDGSCAGEWIKQGSTGFIVPSEDPEIIAKYIKIALNDDELVNNAAKINVKLIKNKVNFNKIKRNIIDMYKNILIEKRGN